MHLPSCDAAHDRWMRATIAGGMLLPLFFLLSGKIYNRDVPLYDSGGRFDTLPLPLSVAVCVIGIAFFLRRLVRAQCAAVFVLAFAAALAISGFVAADGSGFTVRKAILAGQFLLPTMGLVLGQLLNDDDQLIARTFFCLLAAFVPLQLFAGWWQGVLSLTHNLFLFSIYQHFQFVPVIFVAAYCLVLGSPIATSRRNKLLLMIVMGVYSLSSASYLAMGLFAAGTLAYLTMNRIHDANFRLRRADLLLPMLLGIFLLAGVSVLLAKGGMAARYDEGQLFGKFSALAAGKLPLNVTERLDDWARFGAGVTENGVSLLFGHAEPLPREVRTSAHNWYLDLAYNFGLIALIPIAALLAATAFLVWQHRSRLESDLFWLFGVVLFLIVVDANFKVMLRQPYPGLFSFFLWGVLLSKLQALPQHRFSGKRGA